jgi:hypothetical protein
MAIYEVTFEEVLRHTVRVESGSVIEAKQFANEIVKNDPETEYNTKSLGISFVELQFIRLTKE